MPKSKRWHTFFAALLCFILSVPALASAAPQTAASPGDGNSAALQSRINNVLDMLNGAEIEEEVFNQNFLNAVPPEQFRAITRQVVASNGAPISVVSITARDPYNANFAIQFENSVGQFIISLEPTAPNLISGLRITGFESADNNVRDVTAAIAELSGRTGVSVYEITGDNYRPVVQANSTQRFAIASTFKLYILAELDRQIRAGQRKWSDVFALGPKSHPSGISQEWPDNMPMTLQTLATLMVSVSDNSATDTLIRVLGQDALQQMVRQTGHQNPQEFLPFMMTRQVTALKTPANAKLRQNFLERQGRARSAYLQRIDKRLTLESIDFGLLTTTPTFVNELEWFASPNDIILLLAELDKNASPTTKAIMAINNGVGPNAGEKWAYIGYKGGSEAGVLSLNFLLQSQQGRKYAVSIHWNDIDNPVDENRLVQLATRLLNLLSEN